MEFFYLRTLSRNNKNFSTGWPRASSIARPSCCSGVNGLFIEKLVGKTDADRGIFKI